MRFHFLGDEYLKKSSTLSYLSKPTFHTMSNRKIGEIPVVISDIVQCHDSFRRNGHGFEARHDTLWPAKKKGSMSIPTHFEQQKQNDTATHFPVLPEV